MEIKLNHHNKETYSKSEVEALLNNLYQTIKEANTVSAVQFAHNEVQEVFMAIQPICEDGVLDDETKIIFINKVLIDKMDSLK